MSERANILLNGKNIKVEKGKAILEVCRENDIYVPALCEVEILEPYGSCRMCLVEIERDGKKKIETSCSTYVQDGMEIKTDTEEVIESRKINLELLLSEHYGDCIGPCKKACPLHYDVPTYVALIADGKPREALQIIKGSSPFAYSLGAVCPAFCEDECRRQKVEESIAIRLLKKAVADFDMKSDNPYIPEVLEERNERIAIVGGGPAGLTAAYQLRKKGYKITIYEAQDKLGGMLRYGIPEFRLSKAILDREIELALYIGGIDVKYSTKLGKDVSLEELSKNYDVVFVATGAWKDRVMGIEGENLEGVYTGIVFLHAIATNKEVSLGKKVTVIGGGNTAIDVARTAKRLGSDVTILYRRSRNEMPADEKELREAEEEGIEFRTLTNITAILGNGRAEGVRCIKMELGEPDESGRRRPIPLQGSEYEMKTDSVVMAIGQYGDIEEMKEYGIDCGKTWIKASEYLQNTNKANIFAGGDIVLGPATVVESCAQADRAAYAIDLYLNGKLEKVKKVIQEPWNWIQDIESDPELLNSLLLIAPYNHEKEVDEWDFEIYEKSERIKVNIRGPEERNKDFTPIESVFSQEEAIEEAKRCISCGCDALSECKLRKLSSIYKADQYHFKGELIRYRVDERHKYILRDQGKCILCGRCVNECNEILGEYAIDLVNRGFATLIEPPFGKKLDCINCGGCVNVCPTGALEDKKPTEKSGPYPMETIQVTCGECGLGCPVHLRVHNGELLRVETPNDEWNMGILCEQGRYKLLHDYNPGYFHYKDGKGTPVSVDRIISLIKEESNISIILSGDLFTEEAEKLKEYAENSNVGIYIEEKTSKGNAEIKDILKTERIWVGIDLDTYAPIKALIKKAVNNGSCLVKKDNSQALSIVHKNDSLKGKTLVIPKKMNSLGISKLPLPEWNNQEGISIYVGKPDIEVDYAIIPAPYYARSGKVIMLNGEEKEFHSVVKVGAIHELSHQAIHELPLQDFLNRMKEY